MEGLLIGRVELASPEAGLLIGLLNAELTEQYPEEGARHFRLDPEEVAPGRGAFLVARRADMLVGCGAVRLLTPDTAELKRMFTRKEERGRGIGQALLLALEEIARELGAVRLVLETGTRQREAISLYERNSFIRIQPFGEYVSSPLSICMAKQLAFTFPRAGPV